MMESSYKMFFKAFSNGTRFAIIRLLRKGPKNVSQICRALGFEQSRVSHNLKCLEACGFLSSEWRGRNKVYALDASHVRPIIDAMDEHIARYGKRLSCCGFLKGKKNCRHTPKKDRNRKGDLKHA